MKTSGGSEGDEDGRSLAALRACAVGHRVLTPPSRHDRESYRVLLLSFSEAFLVFSFGQYWGHPGAAGMLVAKNVEDFPSTVDAFHDVQQFFLSTLRGWSLKWLKFFTVCALLTESLPPPHS